MGRTINQMFQRYDRWFKWPLDKLWDLLLYLKENYSFFSWLLQRWSEEDMVIHMTCYIILYEYSLCMVVPFPVALNNWMFLFIGLMSAPIYELNLRFYEKYKFKWMEISWLNRANKLTEIEYGFLFGFCILL